MKRPGRFIACLGIGLAFALLMAAWRMPGGVELLVTPVKGDQPLLVLPLDEGERFTIHYFHSVENAPIWEEHSVDSAGRIFIEEERYVKFGAGMGRMPGVGKMVRRGPFEVIENMHMPTGNFILRVGSRGVDHTVIWRGTRTNLSAMIPHEAVQFTALPVNRIQMAWRRLVPNPATPPMNRFSKNDGKNQSAKQSH